MNKLADALDVNLFLALTGLRDVVRSLHTHESVHLHPQRLFDAEGHISRKIGPGIQQAGEARPGNVKRRCSRGHRKARGLNDLGANEIAGMRSRRGSTFLCDRRSAYALSMREGDSILRVSPCRQERQALLPSTPDLWASAEESELPGQDGCPLSFAKSPADFRIHQDTQRLRNIVTW